MSRYDTAGDIINAVAAECGINSTTDPVASSDPVFVQLTKLLTNAGRELIGMHTWERLVKSGTITTTSADKYDLPTDYGSFIDQTGWVPANKLPLGGPLSPQDYTYLRATNLASSTIYISFRPNQGQIWVLPAPPPSGLSITYEYLSRWWVAKAGTPTVLEQDSILRSDNVVLYEPILIVKFLKLRFLGAKGFDTTDATNQFNSVFMQWTGKDLTAPVLSMARMRVFPYLGWRNIPETNFGLP